MESNIHDQRMSITLPDHSRIELDGIPHADWGTEPGKWYTVIHCDEDGREVWRKHWTIPPASQQSSPEPNGDTGRQDSFHHVEKDGNN